MTEVPISRRQLLIGGTAAVSALAVPAIRPGSSARAAAVVDIIPRSHWLALPAREDLTKYSWTPWVGGVIVHHKGQTDTWDPAANHADCYQQLRDVQLEGFEGAGPTSRTTSWSASTASSSRARHVRPVGCQRHGDARREPELLRRHGNDRYEHPARRLGDDVPSAAMVRAIRDLVGYLRQNGSAGPQIKGHRDVATTECPGNKLYAYVTGGQLEPPPSPPSAEVTILPRWRWGARPPREVVRVATGQRVGFTVHHSASPPTATVRAIQNYHMDSNGWSDIGYNFLVDTAGRVYEGRGWDVEGAHASGHNVTHIGACFIGSDGDVTTAALRSLRALYERANQHVGRTLAKTYHGQLPGNATDCPGSQLRTWVQNGMMTDTVPPISDTDPSNGGDGTGMTSVRSVASQQKAVNQAGYVPALDVDGLWGPKTYAGVKWVQGQLNVTADGLWGPNTEAAYLARYGGGTSAGGMTSVRSVASQQTSVNRLGYAPPLAVDGIWGPSTDTGVRWLQGQLGVSADGLWGPDTEAAYQAYFDEGALLAVDGSFGPATVRALQRVTGAAVDGQWGPGSIKALQRHLNTWSNAGLAVDGLWGANTVKAVQRHLNAMIGAGLAVDGVWGYATVTALQKALNRGRF
ncbi:peptidoglycan-binding protein [Micromonospora zhanjiangensis]